MAKLLSDQTAEELPAIFETVRNIQQATRGESKRRDRGIGGAAASRAYVIITGVTNPATYTGNVLKGPDDSEVKKTGVAIRVKGATSNEFEIGYAAFADLSNGSYWLNGSLLG
ncbi:MAG: hypothetical protein ACPH3C_07875 [Glaciecola sp.]